MLKGSRSPDMETEGKSFLCLLAKGIRKGSACAPTGSVDVEALQARS